MCIEHKYFRHSLELSGKKKTHLRALYTLENRSSNLATVFNHMTHDIIVSGNVLCF